MISFDVHIIYSVEWSFLLSCLWHDDRFFSINLDHDMIHPVSDNRADVSKRFDVPMSTSIIKTRDFSPTLWLKHFSKIERDSYNEVFIYQFRSDIIWVDCLLWNTIRGVLQISFESYSHIIAYLSVLFHYRQDDLSGRTRFILDLFLTNFRTFSSIFDPCLFSFRS